MSDIKKALKHRPTIEFTPQALRAFIVRDARLHDLAVEHIEALETALVKEPGSAPLSVHCATSGEAAKVAMASAHKGDEMTRVTGDMVGDAYSRIFPGSPRVHDKWIRVRAGLQAALAASPAQAEGEWQDTRIAFDQDALGYANQVDALIGRGLPLVQQRAAIQLVFIAAMKKAAAPQQEGR